MQSFASTLVLKCCFLSNLVFVESFVFSISRQIDVGRSTAKIFIAPNLSNNTEKDYVNKLRAYSGNIHNEIENELVESIQPFQFRFNENRTTLNIDNATDSIQTGIVACLLKHRLKNNHKMFSKTLRDYCYEPKTDAISHSSLRNHLIIMLTKDFIKSFDGRSLATTTRSIGKLGFSAQQDDRQLELCLCLCDHMTTLGSILSPVDVVKILTGLAGAHLKWRQIVFELQRKLMTVVYGVCADLDARGVSELFSALKTMCVEWRHITPPIQTALLNSVVKQSSQFNSQDISSILYAMGKVGVNLAEVEDDRVRSAIGGAAETLFVGVKTFPGRYSAQQMSLALSGLATLDVKYSEMKPIKQSVLQAALIVCARDTTPLGLSTIVYS